MTPAQIDTAAAALQVVLELDQPADRILSRFFRDRPKLGARDRAFVAEACYGVLRHLRSLQATSEAGTARALLLAWLARHGGHNLREFAELVAPVELEGLKTTKSASLADQSPAVRLDLPDWLYERLLEQHGDAIEALATTLRRPAPLDLRVNTLRQARETVIERLAADGITAAPTPWSPWGVRVQDKPALQRHPLFLDGTIEVQDEGSQLLALLTGVRRGEMVCDFCAGAGGKTLALGAMMRNSGRLYAFDVSEKRLARLKPRLARSGLSNVHPQLLTGERDSKLKRLAGKFSRVLVDAPCSGLGTLRRNPDLKWRHTPTSITELVERQTAILSAAARLTKPGGRLVYATCSLLREENDAVVEAFLTARPDFHLGDAQAELEARGIALEAQPFLRLDPVRHQTDGFFAAVLELSP